MHSLFATPRPVLTKAVSGTRRGESAHSAVYASGPSATSGTDVPGTLYASPRPCPVLRYGMLLSGRERLLSTTAPVAPYARATRCLVLTYVAPDLRYAATGSLWDVRD
eukprot:2380550-Rhodomonas_salina.2